MAGGISPELRDDIAVGVGDNPFGGVRVFDVERRSRDSLDVGIGAVQCIYGDVTVFQFQGDGPVGGQKVPVGVEPAREHRV